MEKYLSITDQLTDYVDEQSELETYNNILNNGSTQRERYKILDKTDFSSAKNILGMNISYKYKLNELNPLLPKLSFSDDDENPLFITSESINDKTIGFTVVGKFREDINGHRKINGVTISDAPDTIDIFISKVNPKDKTITAWRRLNDDFPGLNKIYKGREATKYVTKNLYTDGKSKYDKSMGATVISTNSYNITTTLRVLLSKEESSKKIKTLIEQIKNNDYSAMKFNALYNSSSAYHTQLNTLANEKIENLIFESSGIKDADIIASSTKVGERFLLKKKMNIGVFLDSMNQFKNESVENRILFSKYLADIKKLATDDELDKIDKEPIREFKNKTKLFVKDKKDNKTKKKIKSIKENKKDDIEKLKEYLLNFSKEKFNKNINLVSQYKEELETMIESKPEGKVNLGKFLNKINSEDYLSQKKEIKKALRLLNDKDKTKNANDMYVSKRDLLNTLEKIEKKYSPYVNKIEKEMENVINDRIKIVDFAKYKYLSKLTSDNNDSRMISSDLIEKQIINDYFNAYNEKMDLFQMLINKREKQYISELDLVSSLVQPKFDSDKKVIGYEVRERSQNNTNLNRIYNNDMDWFKQITNKEITEKEFRYGFYKARKQQGASNFDNLTFEEQAKEVSKYLDKNKNLVKKVSTKTTLGKYDSYENFKKAREALKNKQRENDNEYFELLSGGAINTTQDKVISSFNKDMSLNVTLSTFENIGDFKNKKIKESGLLRFNIKFNKNDGFEGNDYIKNMLAVNVGELRENNYETQKYIQNKLDLVKKNVTLQNIISENVRTKLIEADTGRHMLSFLKGNKNNGKAFWGLDKDKNLIYIKDKTDITNIKKLTDYSEVYNQIVKTLAKKNINQVFGLEDKTGEMLSTTVLFNRAFEKNKNITNSLFMNILNRDDIVNMAGGGIQSSFIKGNSNLANLGFTSPGIAFNKMTQRTFQSKDLLGEKTIKVNGTEKSISLINAEILSNLNVGISLRKGKYVTEELLKESTNFMKNKYGINSKDYVRGEVFKTFAIGDFNTTIEKNHSLDAFTSSFQEGMTSSKALKSTTNAIRTKIININLDDIKFDKMIITKDEFKKMITQKGGLEQSLEYILNEDLYKTIRGNKALSNFYEELESKNNLVKNPNSVQLDGFYKELISIANKNIELAHPELSPKKINFEKYKYDKKLSEDEKIVSIMDILENIKFKLGAVAKPTTKAGKNIITNNNVTKPLEIKSEVGFSVSRYSYNSQTNNIELLLENTGSSDPGSKNQAIGAKYTVSAVYDRLKIKDSAGKSYAVAGVFNNKTEKRAQTGMFIHGTLQTLFANVYEVSGLTGVEKLSGNLKHLLGDLGVEVNVDKTKNQYFIDETYLTRDFKGNKITAEQFAESLTNEPLANTNKMFTDRGKIIIEKVSKKYGAKYLDKDGNFKEHGLAHLGVVMEANRGYLKTFNELGISKDKFIPFVFDNAEGIATHDGKESVLGKGSMLLMKMTTERVNSNASKKKESATKIGKEMMYMMKIGGYSDLVDFMRNKQKTKLVNTLNKTFNILNINSYINAIYDRDNNVSTTKLTETLEKNIDNSIVLKLSDIKEDDYLLNYTTLYPEHYKMMNESQLGKLMTNKQLNQLNADNNRLDKTVNVIIQDDTIESFYQDLKSSINNIIGKLDDKKDYKLKLGLKSFIENDKLDMKNIKELINGKDSLDSFLYKNQNTTSKKDGEFVKKFINIIDNNKDDKFALNTLKTVVKTGKMISVVGLKYDVSETDGTIISSEELNKIISLVKNNNKYKNISSDVITTLNKYDKKDTTLIDDIFNGVIRNINHFEKNDNNIFTKLMVEAKDEHLKNRHENVYNTIEALSEFYSESNRFSAEQNAYNNMLEKYGKNLIDTPEQVKEFLNDKEMYLSEFKNELNEKKEVLLKQFSNDETKKIISGKLFNLLFGDYKESNETTKNIIKKMRTIISEEGKEQVDTMFSSMNEYLKMPDEIKRFTSKKSRVYEDMKFRVKTSFVANPIEGSGLLQQFKEMTFDGIENKKDLIKLEKNIDELKALLSSKIVNKNLFLGDDGINYLDALKNHNNSIGYSFSEGVEKAKKVFGKNLAGINGIVITDQKYSSAFRRKDYSITDIDNKITKGINKELTFFSRYPQQTAQHFGSMLTISIDKDRVDNKYAKAAFPFLSNEKNQTGIITLGKRTMLTVRGDHDGDKVQLTFTDFLDSTPELKQKTLNQMFMDFQLKNNNLSRFAEVDDNGKIIGLKGSMFKFTDFNSNIDKNSLNSSVVDLNYRTLDESLEFLQENLGLNKTDIEMKTKYFEDLNFRIGMRAFKELGKHNNSSYDLLAKLHDVVPYSKNYSSSDLDMIEDVLNRFNKDISRTEKYVGSHLEATDNVIKNLRLNNNTGDENALNLVHKMDTISSSVFFTFFKTKPKTADELYKNTFKEIKNIDRGSFTEITVKNAKGIYEELTGIKNTGKTFTYAASLRNTSTEIGDINPTTFLTSLGPRFLNENMNVEELTELKNLQKYYSYGVDATIDNMIESAISAKHGLTLGGLEGSKIFTNLLLSPNSEKLNNETIDLFKKYVVEGDEKTRISTIEKLAKFSKSVSTVNSSFEDAYSEVEKQGLNKSIFQMLINNNGVLKSRKISETEAKAYAKIKKDFLGENFSIEKELLKEFRKNNKFNMTEYQLFEGLSRIGDMLIQNEPGTEFDPDEVLGMLTKLKNNEITKKEFFSNHDIKLIESQLYNSLGDAAAISAIGKTRNYASAFARKTAFEKGIAYLKENLSKDSILMSGEKTLEEYFDNNLNFIGEKTKFTLEEKKEIAALENKTKLSDMDKKRLKDIKSLILDVEDSIQVETAKNITQQHLNKTIEKQFSNPVSFFTEAISSVNAIFTKAGKSQSETSNILESFYNETGYSLNNNNLLDTSIRQSVRESKEFKSKIIADYFDEEFQKIDDVFLDETQSSVFRKNISNILNDIAFKKGKKIIKHMSFNEFKNNDDIVGIFIKKDLNSIEKDLVASNRMIQVNSKNINDFLETISDQKRYYFDDNLFFYDFKGKISAEKMKKMRNIYDMDNVYFSDKMLRTFFKHNKELEDLIITPYQKSTLERDMINAFKLLGEDVNETNVLKRLENPFDYKLASKIIVDDFIKNDSYLINALDKDEYKSYFKKLEKNLSNILLDFSYVENFDNNYDIDSTFLEIAKTLTNEKKDYNSIIKLPQNKNIKSNLKKFDKSIKEFINNNSDLLIDNDVNIDLFKRHSLMSFMNNNFLNDIPMKEKDIIRNSLKNTINNDEVFKDISSSLIDNNYIKNNKKMSLAMLTGATVALLGNKVLQFLTSANKEYISAKGDKQLTEEEILKELNIGNGKKTNMFEQELLNSNSVPRYIDIIKKNF